MRMLRESSPWARAEVGELLEKLVTSTKLSTREIALKINEAFGLSLTRNAIISRVRRVKLPPTKGVGGNPRRKEPRVTKPRKRRPPAPPPKPKVTPVEEMFPAGEVQWSESIGGRKLTILELNDTTCRWPLGDFLDQPPFLYCGNIVSRGCYCRHHASLSYEKPMSRTRPAWPR